MSGLTKRASGVARSALKWSAMVGDAVLGTDGVVILAYHRIIDLGGSQMYLPIDRFKHQMDQLVVEADVMSLDDAVAAMAGPVGEVHPADSGRPMVVLTFDDGTADFATDALPALIERGLPATLYVATGRVCSGRAWPDGAPPLSEAQLQEVADHVLVTVGCHTHDHLLLDRTDPALVADDLDRSIRMLTEICGAPPEHFAYPKALAASPTNEALVRERFASAALAGTRPNQPGHTDVHRLSRSPIQRADTPRHVAHKLRGGMRLEDDVRRLAHRVAYRGARQ